MVHHFNNIYNFDIYLIQKIYNEVIEKNLETKNQYIILYLFCQTKKKKYKEFPSIPTNSLIHPPP